MNEVLLSPQELQALARARLSFRRPKGLWAGAHRAPRTVFF